jgi:membrane protein implicated in regulation of membrane protease activity
MAEVLVQLWSARVPEILFGLAVVLVLIDYFFPVDYPAFIGYACFALGMFFVLPLGLWGSALAAVAILAVVLWLHRVWFSRFLTNAR